MTTIKERTMTDQQVIAKLVRVVEAQQSLDDATDISMRELTKERDSALDAVTDDDMRRARFLAGRYG